MISESFSNLSDSMILCPLKIMGYIWRVQAKVIGVGLIIHLWGHFWRYFGCHELKSFQSCLSMLCLSSLNLCMSCLVPPSFPSPSSASPSSAPQKNFLYPHPFHQWHFQPTSCPSEMFFNVFNPPQKDNFASVHQHLHFYFKLGFQALPENSWWLVSLPEQLSAVSYLDWKVQISRDKEQWKVLISRLFQYDIKAWWKNRWLGVASAFELRADTYK